MAENQIDSTYGSYSLQSSSDSSLSFSMSLSSDTVEDQPSTSGCSSEHPYEKRKIIREKKKEQVKHYLKELKDIVYKPGGKSRKIGSISALQHVVNSIKKIRDNTEESDSQAKSSNFENELSLLIDQPSDLSYKNLQLENQIFITITYPDLIVDKVSQNLPHVLGFPVEAWLGRELLNFLHKRDTVTLNSSLISHNQSSEDELELSEAPEKSAFPQVYSGKKKNKSRSKKKWFTEKVIYLRLRVFKTLQQGFSLEQSKQEYKPFQTTVYSHVKENTSLEEASMVQKQFRIKCEPVSSAYCISVNDMAPGERTFHTRHNLFCIYCYVETEMIPLLGHLPHDMVGNTIFDFYHPEDMECLFEIYKKVVHGKSSPFKGKPFRMRAHNGCWVLVDTEWSSFVNPWSQKIDFVIGKHTVIQGPDVPDVFKCGGKEIEVEMSAKASSIQMKIRELLMQPLKSGLSISFAEEKESISKVSAAGSNELLAGVEESCKNGEGSCKTPDSLSPADGMSLAYEQLNYTNNIKRFLLSQPNSYSTDKRSSSDEKDGEANLSSSTDMDEPVLEIDMSIPKPPSFGSSTKVLLSEQEQREEVASNPNQNQTEMMDDSKEEGQALNINLLPPPAPVEPKPPMQMVPEEKEAHEGMQFEPVSLTQRRLWEHTKQQAELFIKNSGQDNNLSVLLRRGEKMEKESMEVDIVGKKRPHSPDEKNHSAEPKSCKTMGNMGHMQQLVTTMVSLNNHRSMLLPFFSSPIRHKQNLVGAYDLSGTLPALQQSNTIGGAKRGNIVGGHRSHQLDGGGLSSHLVEGFTKADASRSNIPGNIRFNMGAPMTTSSKSSPANQSSTMDSQMLSTSSSNSQLVCSSSFSSSYEDTGSSIVYVLESGSANNESDTSGSKFKNLRSSEPPWLMQVNWSKELQNAYHLPVKIDNKVLHADNKLLKKIKQHEMVLQQFLELENFPMSDPKHMDEETGFLYDNVEDDDADDEAESMLLDPLLFCAHCVQEREKEENQRAAAADTDADMALTCSENMKLKDSSETGSEEKTDFQEPLGLEQVESNYIDSDNGSQQSSDMTPSEERSTEEVSSSLKESYGSSSDQGESSSGRDDSDAGFSDSGNGANHSASKTEGSESSDDQVQDLAKNMSSINIEKYFVPLLVNLPDEKQPYWLKNSVLNDKVEMEYCTSSQQIESRMQEEQLVIRETKQSPLVLEQLQSMLQDLGHLPVKSSSPQAPVSSSSSMASSSDSLPLVAGPQCSSRNKIKLDNFDMVFNQLFVEPITKDNKVKVFEKEEERLEPESSEQQPSSDSGFGSSDSSNRKETQLTKSFSVFDNYLEEVD